MIDLFLNPLSLYFSVPWSAAFLLLLMTQSSFFQGVTSSHRFFSFQSIRRIKKDPDSQLTVDEVVDRIFQAADTDGDGDYRLLWLKKRLRRWILSDLWPVFQATSAQRSLFEVPSRTPGCSPCWSWTWILLGGWWNRGERAHTSEASEHPGLFSRGQMENNQAQMDLSVCVCVCISLVLIKSAFW